MPIETAPLKETSYKLTIQVLPTWAVSPLLSLLSTWGVVFQIEDPPVSEEIAAEMKSEPLTANGQPLQGGDFVPVYDGTLVDLILHFAGADGGTTRAYIKAQAERSGFNVGSVSPTLVKLLMAKLIKRTGKGCYTRTAKRK